MKAKTQVFQAALLITIFLLAGCGASEPTKPTKEEEAREKEIFWNETKPKIVLDPIEEEDRGF